MAEQPKYFRLGVFIIAGVSLIVGGIVTFGSGVFEEKGIPVEMYYDESVQGLDIGAPLKFRGVKIGSVQEISLVRDLYPEASKQFGRYVVVRAEVARPNNPHKRAAQDSFDLDAEVELGFRARLASQGITGLAYIELDYLDPVRYQPPAYDWTPDNTVIPSAPNQITQIAQSIEEVAIGLQESDLPGIAKNLDQLITTIEGAVDEANIDELSQVVTTLVDEVRQTNQGIHNVVNDPEIQAIIHNSLETVEQANAAFSKVEAQLDTVSALLLSTLEETRSAVEEANTTLRDRRIDEAIADIHQVTADAREASELWPQIVNDVQKTLRRADLAVADNTDNVTEIVDSLKRVSLHLESLTALLNKYPSHAIFGEAPPPMENEK